MVAADVPGSAAAAIEFASATDATIPARKAAAKTGLWRGSNSYLLDLDARLREAGIRRFVLVTNVTQGSPVRRGERGLTYTPSRCNPFGHGRFRRVPALVAGAAAPFAPGLGPCAS